MDQSTSRGKYLYKKVEGFFKEYNKILESAVKIETNDNILVFKHPNTKHSFVSEISTELVHIKKKVILVYREVDGRMKISLRSNKLKINDILEKILEDFDGYGGGHEFACAANIGKEEFPEFLERFKKEINKLSI